MVDIDTRSPRRPADLVDLVGALPRQRRLLLVLAAVAVALIAVNAYGRQELKDFDLLHAAGAVERDGSYTDTAQVLDAGDDDGRAAVPLYIPGPPPLIALVFQPLSTVPVDSARVLFLVASAGATLAALRLAQPRDWPVWAVVLALTAGTIWGVALGQVSLLITGLVIAAYGFWTGGRSTAAGLALGVAAALKLYPAFLLVPLLCHRDWRAVRAAVAVGGALGLLTVPALGLHDTRLAIERTVNVASTVDPWIHNQSAPAVIARAWGDGVAGAAGLVLTAVSVATLVAVARRASPAVTFAVAVLLMLISQSLTWEHYLPLAIVGLFGLREAGASRQEVVLCATGYAVVALPFVYDSMLGYDGIAALVTGPRLLGLVLMTVPLLRAALRRTALPAPSAVPVTR